MPGSISMLATHRSTSAGRKFVVRSARAGLSKALSGTRLHEADRLTVPKFVYTEGDEDMDFMSSSFHQFCTTCEKQIGVLNNTILYCSERCRRRDSRPSSIGSPSLAPLNGGVSSSDTCRPALSSDGSSSSSSSSGPQSPHLSEYETFIGRRLLSRRKQPSGVQSSFQVLHDGKTDMDPTEWKPDAISVSMTPVGGNDGPSVAGGSTVTQPTSELDAVAATSGKETSRSSDAFLYLSQFHRSSESFASLSATSSTRRTLRTHLAAWTFGDESSSSGLSSASSSSASSSAASMIDAPGVLTCDGEDTAASSVIATPAILSSSAVVDGDHVTIIQAEIEAELAYPKKLVPSQVTTREIALSELDGGDAAVAAGTTSSLGMLLASAGRSTVAG